MGFLKKIFVEKRKVDQEIMKLVTAFDNGEEWARQELYKRHQNDNSIISQVDAARIEIYGEAAREGDSQAQYWLGCALRTTNKEESLKWLENLTRQGDTEAMKAIAFGYTKVGGYGEDEKSKLYWLTMAANVGDAEAQYKVGIEYLIGSALPRNHDKAFEWFLLSAGQKYPKGMLELAEQYIGRKTRLQKSEEYTDEEWKEQFREWEKQALDLCREVIELEDYDARMRAIVQIGWIVLNPWSPHFDITQAMYSFYYANYRSDQPSIDIIKEIEVNYKEYLTDEMLMQIREDAKPRE